MNQKAIIYTSYHHQNTYNLIKSVVSEKEYDWVNLLENAEVNLEHYKTIIFASGIYGFRMHENLMKFIKNNQTLLKNKQLALVITSSMNPDNHARRAFKFFNKLNLGHIVIFGTRGFNTFGPFKLFGGANKNRPNEEDQLNLKEFIAENEL